MKYRTIPVEAQRLKEGTIVKTKDGLARVIEIVKNLSANKYKCGYEIEVEYFKSKRRKILIFGARDELQTRVSTGDDK